MVYDDNKINKETFLRNITFLDNLGLFNTADNFWMIHREVEFIRD